MKTLRIAFATFAALPFAALAGEPETEAVEYYNAASNHYFITATAAEARMIDDGAAGAGWVRTGRSFQAWLDPAGAPANAAGVCRFYSRGANSHFYTANAGECEFLKSLEAAERARVGVGAVQGWQYEGIAFRIESPSGEACPAGTTALSRVYNNGFVSGEGSNHRFVDDSELRGLMLDRSWVGEGIAFCARSKASGSNANLAPTTTGFQSLAATWQGTGRWKVEAAGVETRTSAPITLAIAANGAATGSGAGCAFTGQVQQGDGFRSLFTGTVSATGCANAAFNGAYRRFNLERFSAGTLAVHLKRGDNANEAEVEALLTTGSAPVDPTPGSGTVTGITGDWAGTVGWTVLRRQGGAETILVSANRPLALAIAATGAVSGTGFGCALSGTLSASAVAGRFGGRVTAGGCTEGAFNGTYVDVSVHRDDGSLEVELEKESEAAGVTTKAKVEGLLASGGGTPVPVDPVNPGTPAGIAGAYQGAFTAEIEIRNRVNGNDTTSVTSVSATAQFRVAAGGALTGTGFGCTIAGSLALTNATLQLYGGTVTASGCTNAALNGSYTAGAHREDGGALELELERETESANVRTKVKWRGTAARTGA